MAAASPLAPSEKEFQNTLVELLETLGWAHCHTYPLQTKHGYRTGTTAKGWPDLVALRGEFVVAIEVKSDTGRVTAEQVEWLDRFARLGCGRAWLVDPSLPLQQLAEWLQHPDGAPVVFGYRQIPPV